MKYKSEHEYCCGRSSALLLLLQIQFLPFHDTRITWAQRGALVVDVLLLWPLRPPILTDLSAESYGRAQLFSRALRTLGLAGRFCHGRHCRLVFHGSRDHSRANGRKQRSARSIDRDGRSPMRSWITALCEQ